MENQSSGFDFNAMPMKKKVTLPAAGLGLISCFLPFASIGWFDVMYGVGFIIRLGAMDVA